jgi:hypothetical protein
MFAPFGVETTVVGLLSVVPNGDPLICVRMPVW